MRRREVLFAVIGGVVRAVLVMAAGQFSPRVGRIACTGLEVVDSKGNPRVRLSADEHGRRVVVYPKDDKPEAKMGIGKHGRYVHVSGGNEDYRSKAMMYIAPYGGAINTRDKNGNRLADLR